MKFQRIQDLRIDNDLTIKEISAMLGLHRDVYSRYEKGLRDFPIDILIKLADIYHCSIDYLVGRLIRSNIIHKMPTPQTLITIYKEKTIPLRIVFLYNICLFFPTQQLNDLPLIHHCHNNDQCNRHQTIPFIDLHSGDITDTGK